MYVFPAPFPAYLTILTAGEANLPSLLKNTLAAQEKQTKTLSSVSFTGQLTGYQKTLTSLPCPEINLLFLQVLSGRRGSFHALVMAEWPCGSWSL